jgi:hypothetical protein
MPVSSGFVNWLEENPQYVEKIGKRLAAPRRGVLMAVEIEEFWPKSWGERPSEEEKALKKAGQYLEQAAPLIPLYRHRYLPSFGATDAPVLSVYGGDIIYYGANLRNWLQIEFCQLPHTTIFEMERMEIPGWNSLIS